MSNVPGQKCWCSVQVFAGATTASVTVTVSGLTSGANTIAAAQADVRAVQSWWRPTDAWKTWIRSGMTDELTPDLLVHDLSMIAVDIAARTVTVDGTERTTKVVDDAYSRPTFAAEQVVDASSLQAFTIPAGYTQPLLIEVAIPSDAVAGTYTGTISIKVSGSEVISLPVELRVLSFALEAAPIAAVYFTQYVADAADTESTTSAGNSAVTSARLAAMLAELADAGVNPTCSAPFGSSGDATRALFEAHLAARVAVGMASWPLYYLGSPSIGGSDFTRDASGKAAIQAHVEEMLSVMAAQGVTGDLYIYGTDENATALDLDAPLYRGIHDGGGKAMVSIADGSYAQLTDKTTLDLVTSHSSTPSEIALWTGSGIAVGKYGSPQAGAACPNLYRRNMGLGAWAIGADGPFDWCFCYMRGDMWNGFDSASYIEEMMVYPLYNSQLLPTWKWIGYRQAVNDLRMVKTLEARIAASALPLATVAQSYLTDLATRLKAEYPADNSWTDTSIDLDHERARIIGYIEALIG